MSILIGADIVPTLLNLDLFVAGDALNLLGNALFALLKSADYRVFNLETPLTDICSPIEKRGPALHADCETVNAMKNMNVNLFTLANNHILDQGNSGLESTFKTLEQKEIAYLGAGKNLHEAQKPYIVTIDEKKFGFYACAENEFSIATEKSAGANPFDALESFDHVANLRAECDCVVVLYHGGKEHYRYPSPMLQKVCRKFIEKGANLVVCQHSHCIGCEEKFKNGTIVYGQGNFLFDSCGGSFADQSLLIRLSDDLQVEYIPLIRQNHSVRLAEGEVGEKILKEFKNRSEQIKEEGFVENEYAKFAERMIARYLVHFSGYSHKLLYFILKKLFRRRFNKMFVKAYKKNELLAIQNFVECEAHRELLLRGLKKRE